MIFNFVFLISCVNLDWYFLLFMRGTTGNSNLLFDPEIEKLARKTRKEARARQSKERQVSQEEVMVENNQNHGGAEFNGGNCVG